MPRNKRLAALILATLIFIAWFYLPPLRTFIPKATLPQLNSSDFELVITSDKSTYKLGETPRFTAKIVNRSDKTAYLHYWKPAKPPGLIIEVGRPEMAIPTDRDSESWCAPSYRYFWGTGYANKFIELLPATSMALNPCRQLPQGIFNSPGTYVITIAYTNETDEFDQFLDSVTTGYINHTYADDEGNTGSWIRFDADELEGPPYGPIERDSSITLLDKGPWIGSGLRRRRVTLQELIDVTPRVTLKSEALSITVAEPVPIPNPLSLDTAEVYLREILFPPPLSRWPRYERLIQKVQNLGHLAYPALELLLYDSSTREEKAYLFEFFSHVPGDPAHPQAAAVRLIQEHLRAPRSDDIALPDIHKAAEILGMYGDTEDCDLLLDYLEARNDAGSWSAFMAVKRLADDEVLRRFVDLLAKKVNYGHSGDLWEQSIFVWGEDVVIRAETDLLRLAKKSERDRKELRSFSAVRDTFGDRVLLLRSMASHNESALPPEKRTFETAARELLLKDASALAKFNQTRHYRL